ncbi:MAG: chemotaxis protein CheA [Anaerolineae bacterium]|nr:chemotaxis protein CheA [Anaerolineae bacterium]
MTATRHPLQLDIEPEEIELFLREVNELLAVLESAILQLERLADPATLDAAFRAAHTLKAIAATVGHQPMAELTHALETIFETMRTGQLSWSPAITDELFAVVDILKALRDEVVRGEGNGVDVGSLLTRLAALAGRQSDDSLTPAAPSPGAPLLTTEQRTAVEAYRQQGFTIFEIEVTVHIDAFARGARLLQATKALAEIGHIITQQPPVEELLAGHHEGHVWLILATRATVGAIEEALGQLCDVAGFRVLPWQGDALAEKASPAAAPSPDAPVISPAIRQSLADQTVHISTERLDRLLNLVGELITARTRLAQIQDLLAKKWGNDGEILALKETTAHVHRVMDRLQEEVMALRLVPIARLFRKFPRLVRDLARAGGKQVTLMLAGEDTELDRSVVELIGEPLIHLLRNAVDHGIEPPQERLAAGKSPSGTIWLTAAPEEGRITITVRDDGRGIEPGRIRRAAVARGLLTEEEAARLDDEAAVNLIFRPHFSTSETVTDVSGRGIGLDVVLNNVKQLSGSVAVESHPGYGTTFRLTLPLTLAILQAMMVAAGEEVYAIPLTAIVESIYLSSVEVGYIKGRPAIPWRNQVLPILYLREVFARTCVDQDNIAAKQQAIVVVAWGKLKAGLVVDRLLGKQEVVIKPLGALIGNVPGISGCTIMGDGRVALIVDVGGLLTTIDGHLGGDRHLRSEREMK